ncbi:hypothetical protein G7069_06350 [Lysobacter sp. HDW10]|uniref:hypothetical protein n=1 Tax=Lysobacter sp. HDW10 TaxID=2714936 RepID=UPI0014096DE2|nr:hypothetical protein [Lysobacter sp. HDW10]QIK81248.1 hypothetical protein G7069_06350 [Lysobacter sp. HDW10]
MDAVPSLKELRQMAELKALETSSLIRAGVDSEEILSRSVASFKDTYQPLLVDKVFTALFQTYSQWFIAAVRNLLEPGSAIYEEPVSVASIGDGQVIRRMNRLNLSEDLLNEYKTAIGCLAQECGSQMVQAGAAGKDAREVLVNFNLAATKLEFDFGLTEQESLDTFDLFSGQVAKEVDRRLSSDD